MAANRSHAAADRAEQQLAGAGRSALTAEAALRARDLNRPSPQDLAEAEVVIVRRHWQPPSGS